MQLITLYEELFRPISWKSKMEVENIQKSTQSLKFQPEYFSIICHRKYCCSENLRKIIRVTHVTSQSGTGQNVKRQTCHWMKYQSFTKTKFHTEKISQAKTESKIDQPERESLLLKT